MMNFNDYSARSTREQYEAVRWVLRTKQGGFICEPNGVPAHVWAAARRVKLQDFPRDPLDGSKDLRRIKVEAKGRGYKLVATMSGLLPIDSWTPYGNGIERTARFRWVAPNQVRDDPAKPLGGFLLGVWSFHGGSDAAA
jgi:hypothetical protein